MTYQLIQDDVMVAKTESFPWDTKFSWVEKGQDYICRVIGSTSLTSSRPTILTWKTDDVQFQFTHTIGVLEERIRTLRAVVRWQKHRLDYQAVYSAYLMGSLTEDEFIAESEPFTSDHRVLPSDSIVQCMTDLDVALGYQMEVDDYADILGVPLETVLEVGPRIEAASTPQLISNH